MSEILWLDEVGPADGGRVGAKAHRCAQMRQGGLPVPDGVIVAAGAAQTDATLAQLQSHLEHWPAGTAFAVRSSALDEDGAHHSFAGMHDTRLDVCVGDVPDAVRACWASVRSERALAYREAHGIAAGPRTAVLVQEMVRAIAAGVVFTRNPLDDADEVVINAAVGLGEALVSGMVDPEEWRLRKSDLALFSRRMGGADGARWLLSDDQARELAALSLRVERLFGGAQDIEWCHDGRQFCIVQARPVTGVTKRETEIEWSRANVREVLPDLPSPQVLDSVLFMINEGEGAYGGRLFAPEAELGPLMKAFNGRPYFNVSQIRHVCPILRIAPAQMLKSVGYTELRPEDELIPARRWALYVRALPDLLRVSSYQVRLGGMMRKYLRELAEEVEFVRRQLGGAIDARTMWRHMQARRKNAPQQLLPVFALSAVATLEQTLRKILLRIPFPYEDLAGPVLAAGEKSVSSQQAFDLLRLAAVAREDGGVRKYFAQSDSFTAYRPALAGTEFLRKFDEFLVAYGHRGHYETEWSLPRYAEDPTPLLTAIGTHLKSASSPSADEIIARQEREAQAAWVRFDRALNRSKKMVLRPMVRALLRRIKQMYLWRELYRSELARVATQLRAWHLHLAQKLVAQGLLARSEDHFLLTYDEIGAAVEGRMNAAAVQQIIARRRAELQAWGQLDMPLSLRESELPRIRPRGHVAEYGAMCELNGLCVSRGVAEGEVVVLHTPADFARMKRGAIIVAPATDPSWTPLFTLASGLIVEIGGLLSHASTVAREYGLPALANVAHATQLLKDGDRVLLDATAGRTQVLAPAATATSK